MGLCLRVCRHSKLGVGLRVLKGRRRSGMQVWLGTGDLGVRTEVRA